MRARINSGARGTPPLPFVPIGGFVPETFIIELQYEI